ncbi:MAG: insulinase family protein [Pirellulales bacterium]|nr:insulinase family protein [Pirellulales bacterium]
MTQVVALPEPGDPTVCFRLWIRVGSENDPPGKEGLANLTAEMLTQASTRQNSYEQILAKLFPLAGSYDATVSVEMSVIAGRIHRDNLSEYCPLLMQAVCEPAFLPNDLERLKSQTLNYLQNSLRYSSDEELGKAVLYNTIFRGTPYGHLPDGTVRGVTSITVDDLRDFYRRYYTRENVILGLGGGYDEALLTRLRTDLATLPTGTPETVPPPTPRPISGRQVVIVEKGKGTPATAISIGFPISVLRGSRDWYALAVANSWLGEHRNSHSHLYQVLREARGLNYGDYSYIEHYPNGGSWEVPPVNVARRQQIFEIWLRPVPNAARVFALRGALRELKLLTDNGLTEGQFTAARNFLSKYTRHYAPTVMARLGYALDDKFYGITGGHLQNYPKILDELTREEVNAAIKKYLQYENLQIVFVTQGAAALKEALISDAPSPYKYPTPVPDSVLKEDQEIQTFPLKIPPENVTIVPVDEVFEK